MIDEEAYNQINYEELLGIQNEVSRNAREGFIWMLNTCVFIVAEFNFGIIENQIKLVRHSHQFV